MKPLSKFLLQALCLMFLFSTSCYFPGTEKGNLRLLPSDRELYEQIKKINKLK